MKLYYLLLTNTTLVTRAVDVALKVVRVICCKLALRAELCAVADFGAVILALDASFLVYAVYAYNATRNAGSLWKLLAVLTSLSAIWCAHRYLLDSTLMCKRN